MASEGVALPHDHGQRIEGRLDSVPSSGAFASAANMFRLLGDTSRLRIFWVLCHCEECLVNLSSIVGMSSPAVSHHLKILKASGLVVSRRDGKEVYYTAADCEQVRELHGIVERMMDIACPEL